MRNTININTPPFIYAQHLIEWFNCPLRALELIHNNNSSLTIASRYRENIRLLHLFLNDIKRVRLVSVDTTDSTEKNKTNTIQTALEYSSRMFEKKQAIHEALFRIKNIVLLFIPYMCWDTETKSWCLFYGMASNSHKRESLLQASLMILHSREYNIPISKIFFFTHYKFKMIDRQFSQNEIIHQKRQHNNDIIDTITSRLHHWRFFDVTKKAYEYATQEKNTFKQLLSIIEKDDALHNRNYWKGCNKQYCETCASEEQYMINDIRTLRRSKHITDELYKKGITQITELPEKLPFDEVAQRQILAVTKNTTIIKKHEINGMLHEMEYPRYYLDFEAFNNSVPFLDKTKSWEYTPFLFSLQWQFHPQDNIYTKLWAMPPGEDKQNEMWDILKQHLYNAGSIIVYSSQFEESILKQLAYRANEIDVFSIIQSKIVDLQKLFFNLSLYNPKQKGKISLKIIADIWTHISYKTFNISEGIAANYYYVTFCDEKKNAFRDISKSPYLSSIFKTAKEIEDPNITLKDIMEYCKHDTKVMIYIVSLLEDIIAETYP